MRITLSKDPVIDKLIKLCNKEGKSPTQLIIDLIDTHFEHAQLGCKENANIKENSENTSQ